MDNKLEGVSEAAVEAVAHDIWLTDVGNNDQAYWVEADQPTYRIYAQAAIAALLASGEVITKAEHEARLEVARDALKTIRDLAWGDKNKTGAAGRLADCNIIAYKALSHFTTNPATTGETE